MARAMAHIGHAHRLPLGNSTLSQNLPFMQRRFDTHFRITPDPTKVGQRNAKSHF